MDLMESFTFKIAVKENFQEYFDSISLPKKKNYYRFDTLLFNIFVIILKQKLY